MCLVAVEQKRIEGVCCLDCGDQPQGVRNLRYLPVRVLHCINVRGDGLAMILYLHHSFSTNNEGKKGMKKKSQQPWYSLPKLNHNPLTSIGCFILSSHCYSFRNATKSSSYPPVRSSCFLQLVGFLRAEVEFPLGLSSSTFSLSLTRLL